MSSCPGRSAARCIFGLLLLTGWVRPAFTAAAHVSRTVVAQRTRPPLVVGYFGQWSLYDGYSLHDLDANGAAARLDQINYAQAFVKDGRCTVADPHADLDVAFTEKNSVDGQADHPGAHFHGNLHQLALLKRKHPRLRTLISLEGRAADFAADAQPAAREQFVHSCVDLFLRGDLAPGVHAPRLFDGIDLDWEYPAPADSANFLALLREFRRQMDTVRPGLRLSIAVGISPRDYLAGDLPAVAKLVDQMGVMNYDYSGPWSQRTGLLAPLRRPEGSQVYTVEASLQAWQDAGVPREKLLMGLPFYGYGWKGVAREGNGLFQPGKPVRGDRPFSFFQALLRPPVAGGLKPLPAEARVPAAPALTGSSPAPAVPQQGPTLPPAVKAPPLLLFRDTASMAPWLYDGDNFWTFEDATSIRTKARFARDAHLGGIMIWELSEDSEDAALLHAADAGLRAGR